MALRGTAYYQCDPYNCRHKWKLRNSSGSTKDCPECGKSGIVRYRFIPNVEKPRERRMFGDFDCACGNAWKSAYTWVTMPGNIRKWQNCRSCNAEVYPTNVRPLLYSGGTSNSQSPHDSARCQKCRECGGDCRNYVPPEPNPQEDEDDDDQLSVMSAASSVSGLSGGGDVYDDRDRTPVASDSEGETEDLLSEQLKDLSVK